MYIFCIPTEEVVQINVEDQVPEGDDVRIQALPLPE